MKISKRQREQMYQFFKTCANLTLLLFNLVFQTDILLLF